MEFRRARPGDEDGIGLVHIRSWQTTYRGIVPQEHLDNLNLEKRVAWLAKVLRQVESLNQTMWVAVDEAGAIVGFAHGGPPQEPEEGYTSELYALYLLQSVQGRGIGRRLVELVARDLWDAGHRTMLVGVLVENSARLFYERLGAQPVRDFPIERAGKVLMERYYGWTDISVLLP